MGLAGIPALLLTVGSLLVLDTPNNLIDGFASIIALLEGITFVLLSFEYILFI